MIMAKLLIAISVLVALSMSPAEAAPRSINKCMTIDRAGSYVLTRNIRSDRDCLIVDADSSPSISEAGSSLVPIAKRVRAFEAMGTVSWCVTGQSRTSGAVWALATALSSRTCGA
jgi:hypothetical protein